MASASLSALIIFIAWALLLMVLMEVMRSRLVLQRVVAANGFTPDNANLSPFMQRLARAHANCVENIPLFGGLLLVAVVSDRQYVTDPLAMLLVGARIVQSLVHLASGSSLAASLRFLAFAVQLAIGLYWTFRLLATA